MSNIFVRIIGEFKDKEFKRAQKSTMGLNKQFDNLRRSATRAFVAVAGISALKRSVKAFAESDLASRNLAKSLDNLGLKYEAVGVDDFIKQLEYASLVTKEQLYPAFRNLANATLSVAKSQELLSVALDIAAGTGASVTTVANALSKAFNGNYAALGKLQNGYTAAELEALGFQKSVELLSNEFSGQAANDADTYQGKIHKLNLAMGDAAEAIGEGLVDALEALGSGNYDKGLENIVTIGEKIGDAFRGAARFAAVIKLILGSFSMSSKEFEAAAQALNSTFAPDDPAKQRALFRERAKYLKEEQKQTEKIRKDREKSAKALKEDSKNQKIISEAQKKFDMERIQIEAALQGKINDVEEYRLKLQRAIINENVDNVVKYTGLLREAEAQAAELAELLAKLPEMAENPFTDWPATIARIQYLLKELDFQIPIEVLFAEKGLKLDQDKMTVTKLETMQVDANNVFINGKNINDLLKKNGLVTPEGALYAASKEAAEAEATAQEAAVAAAEAESEVALTDAAIAEIDAILAESEAAAALITTNRLLSEFDDVFNMLSQQGLLSPIGAGDFRMREEAINVTVNVGGNVTSEADLVQSITNSLYNIQSNGQVLLHKRTIL